MKPETSKKKDIYRLPRATPCSIISDNFSKERDGIKRGRSCNKDFVYFDNEWRSHGTRALDEFYKIVCSSCTTGTKLYPLNPRHLRTDTQRFRWNIYPVNATALRAMDKFITANIPSMRSRSPCYKASSDREKKKKYGELLSRRTHNNISTCVSRLRGTRCS